MYISFNRDEVNSTVSPVLPHPGGPGGGVSAPQYSPLGHPPLYPVLNSPDQHNHMYNQVCSALLTVTIMDSDPEHFTWKT